MLFYFIMLFVVVLSTQMANRIKSPSTESRFFLLIAFSSMVLVAGMRDRTVGTDTGSYVRYFNDMRTFADVVVTSGKMWEYGFWLLTWLLHFISDQYVVYLFAIALIVVGCYQWSIVAYSENIGISFFVFITMGFYTFFFNGARQGIACAIYALAIGPLLERNFKKYLAYVLLAFLFHKSAIILLPVYFVFGRANTLKANMLILLTGCMVAYFFQQIVEVGAQFDARYEGYATAGEGGGYYTVAFVCALCLFFLLFRRSVRVDKDRYGLFLNMLMFGTMVGVVSSFLSTNPSGFLRYSVYFNIGSVFLWPIVFRNITDRSSKLLVGYFFVVGYLVYFALTTQRFSNLTPYTFNQSILNK
jgi:hypothetical protein